METNKRPAVVGELVAIFKKFNVPSDRMTELIPKIYGSIPQTEKEALLVKYAPVYLQAQGYTTDGAPTEEAPDADMQEYDKLLGEMKQCVMDEEWADRLSTLLMRMCDNNPTGLDMYARKYYSLAYVATGGDLRRLNAKIGMPDIEIKDPVLNQVYGHMDKFPKDKDVTDGLPNCDDVRKLKHAWQMFQRGELKLVKRG